MFIKIGDLQPIISIIKPFDINEKKVKKSLGKVLEQVKVEEDKVAKDEKEGK